MFDGREFVVPRGVFDPVHHLSGLAFATHLLTLDLDELRILDLGTGSGILAAAAHRRGAEVIATDIDPRAVVCANRNLRETGIDVRCGDLFETVASERFDLVVVNPPYEIGPARRPTIRSPDILERLGSTWSTVGSALLLAFPTDAIGELRAAGITAVLSHRIPTAGRELGIFSSP